MRYVGLCALNLDKSYGAHGASRFCYEALLMVPIRRCGTGFNPEETSMRS